MPCRTAVSVLLLPFFSTSCPWKGAVLRAEHGHWAFLHCWFSSGHSTCLWQCRSTAHTGQAHTVVLRLCCACGSTAAATQGISNHRSGMWVCHPPAGLMDAFPLPHRPADGEADERFMASLFLCCPTIACKLNCPLQRKVVFLGLSHLNSAVLHFSLLGAILPLLVFAVLCKYRYLGFVVCFNSQTSVSSSKLSLRFSKSYAWGSEQVASGHIPCYVSQGSIWKSFIL